MGVGLDGGLYRLLLLLLHILCVAVGFGAVVFNGLCRTRARQRGGEAEVVVLEENGYITRIAEFLIYGVLVFGILVALTSRSYWEFSQQRIGLGWAAFDVLFLVILYLMVFTPGHVRAG